MADICSSKLLLPLWCADWIILECLESDYQPGVDKQSYRIYADAYHKPYLQLRPEEIAELAREHREDIIKFQHESLQDLLLQMMQSYRTIAELCPSVIKPLNQELIPDLQKMIGRLVGIDDADGSDTSVRLQLSMRSYHPALSQLLTDNSGGLPDKNADKELCQRYIDKVISDVTGLFRRYADNRNYTAQDYRTQLVHQGVLDACKTVLLLFNLEQPLLTSSSTEALFKLILQQLLRYVKGDKLIDRLDSQIYHRSGLSLANAVCLRPDSTVELPATYSSRLSTTYRFLLAMMLHNQYLWQIRKDHSTINGYQLTPVDDRTLDELQYATISAVNDLRQLKDYSDRTWQSGTKGQKFRLVPFD